MCELFFYVGRGYYSIIIKRVWVPGSWALTAYLYIGNEKVMTGTAEEYCDQCDIFKMYTTGLVDKNQMISVSADSKSDYCGHSIVKCVRKPFINVSLTDGTVNNPMTYVIKERQMYTLGNRKETVLFEAVVFWQDEYEVSPISNMFLSKEGQQNAVAARYLDSVAQKQLEMKNLKTYDERKLNMFRMNSYG